jgi:hypothetical protein
MHATSILSRLRLLIVSAALTGFIPGCDMDDDISDRDGQADGDEDCDKPGKPGKHRPPPCDENGEPLPPPVDENGEPLPPPVDENGDPLPPPTCDGEGDAQPAAE